MSANNSQAPTPGQIIDGGTTITAIRSDGSGSEQVHVKLLSIREIQRYFENGDDIAFLAELFTGKPKGWSELVTVKTCLDVVERGEALNRSPLPGSAEPGPIVQFIQTQERRRAALGQLQASTRRP